MQSEMNNKSQSEASTSQPRLLPEEPMDDMPSMTSEIHSYLNELVEKVGTADLRAKVNVRTSDTTSTNFAATKRDRLWSMKTNGEFVDSVLVTADGYREPLHMDLVLALSQEDSVPFYQAVHRDAAEPGSTAPPRLCEYIVDASISSAVLQQLVAFVYHRRCAMTTENSMVLATVGAKYRIKSLVQYCLAFLLDHCSPANVIMAFQLASDAAFVSKSAAEFFQKYIEDNFEEIWTANRASLLSLNFETISTVLTWDKLNIKSECIVWQVIEAWVNADRATRLGDLARLIKQCLRFGRLPEQYIRDSILNGALFLAQPADAQLEVSSLMDRVLHGELLKQTISDGRQLLYAKSIFYFRPRETKHLLLCAGGWIEGKTTSSIELYDYQLNLWLFTPLKLPSAVSYFGLEMLGDILYVFGGSNSREIYKAMSALDLSKPELRWVGRCSMIERRCYVSSVVLDGSIYALGGFNQQRRIRKCERYNQQTDSWFEIAELNYARSDASAAAYNGRIYIAGGINDASIEPSVEVYDPRANIWQMVKHMATPRTSFALACYGNRIWAIAGNDGHRRLNSCESYDPETDSWREEPPLVTNRSTFRAINFNGELLVVGGYNSENPIRSVEKYVPNQGWVKTRMLLHERSGLSLVSVPNIYASLQK